MTPWGNTSSLATAREHHTATLLPNGKVLVTGGDNSSSGSGLASAELYDPATGMWTTTGRLAAARYGNTATLLPNGKVLVNGGNGNVSSAELYDVGLGFSATWQPQISTGAFNGNGQFVLSGSHFRGISGGSSGNMQDSPTDYPVVQLRWLDNGQSRFLDRDSASSASDTAFTSTAGVNASRIGYASETVYSGGIPSSAMVVVSQLPPTSDCAHEVERHEHRRDAGRHLRQRRRGGHHGSWSGLCEDER